MTTLIATLGIGKGSWAELYRLIDSHPWQKVVLFTNQFGKERFSPKDNVELLLVDFDKPLAGLVADMATALKGKVDPFDTAINLTSGAGKEHMALLSAVLKQGCGVRFVVPSENGIEEL